MTPAQSAQFGVFYCRLLEGEVRKSLKSLGVADTPVACVSTNCYETATNRTHSLVPVERLAGRAEHVIGMCMSCIRPPGKTRVGTDPFSAIESAQISRVFSSTPGAMFLGDEAADELLGEGAFILMPGWLRGWKHVVTEVWGFDEDTAKLFFRETVKRLVCLDTGVDGPWREDLAAMSAFVGVPAETRYVGTSVLEAMLGREVERVRATRAEAKVRHQLQRARVSAAEHAALATFVTELGDSLDESVIISRLIALANLLFDAESVEYVAVSSQAASPHPPAGAQGSIARALDDDSAFAVEVAHAGVPLGTLSVRGLAHPASRESYFASACTAANAAAVALHAARLHQRERDLATSLAAQVEALESFVRMASHDLREPLRTVASFSMALKEELGTSLSADAQQYLDYMGAGTGRMQRLIDSLLALSRSDRSPLDCRSVSLERCLNDALSGLDLAVEKSGAIVTSDPLPNVVVDAVLVTQVFQNLIANAIKYRGEKQPRIHVTVEDVSGVRVFGVRDNGIGIASAYLSTIFEPFRRLHREEEIEGSGIGLSVCRTVVQRHGGEMWAESELGAGSHFRFTLGHVRAQ